MAQASVSQYYQAAFAGLLDGLDRNIIDTYPAGEDIPLGNIVRQGDGGTGGNVNRVYKCNYTTSGLLAIGFAVAQGKQQQATNGALDYKSGEPVPVLKSGRLWANAISAIAFPGLELRLDTVSGLLTSAAAGGAVEEIADMVVRSLTTTTAAGLVLVEVWHK